MGAYAPGTTLEALAGELRDTLHSLTRRGAVIGVSGGVDSAACAALAARALPADRIRLVAMPDRESSGDSRTLARDLASSLGVELIEQDLTAALVGLGVYDELADRVAVVLDRPASEVRDWKLVRSEPSASLPVRWRVAGTTRDGEAVTSSSLKPRDLAFITARMSYKQQLRTSVLYRVAEEEHFLVVGTANRVELRTGFFVRHGDGSADVFPLRDLFKAEVRSLAAELGVPAAITGRTATTDTFSAAQTQREFFFGVDEAPFDHVLFGFETGQSAAAVAQIARVAVDVVEGVYADLTRRQPFLRYLLSQPLPDEL